jgi:hypothetical protein
MKSLGRVGLVLPVSSFDAKLRVSRKRSTYVAHSRNSVLASEPDTLNIDALGQVPDPLFGVDGIVIAAISRVLSDERSPTHAGCMIPALLNCYQHSP